MRALRPGTIQPCKICSAPAPVYGSVDFNKNCEAARGLTLPAAGIPVSYNRCPRCGFLFTAAFNEWGRADYQQAIYNDDYIVVDPDYRETRPAANAAMLTKTFETHKHELSLLDYGGGNGVLAGKLAEAGFPSPATYDPFTPAFATLPAKRFNIVTCFETLEHVPDPRRQVAAIAMQVQGGQPAVARLHPPTVQAHAVAGAQPHVLRARFRLCVPPTARITSRLINQAADNEINRTVDKGGED